MSLRYGHLALGGVVSGSVDKHGNPLALCNASLAGRSPIQQEPETDAQCEEIRERCYDEQSIVRSCTRSE